jgi:hypothetical protein
MSKVYPYETMDDALVCIMLKEIPEVFDEFVLHMVQFSIISEKHPGIKEIRLPYMFLDEPLIKNYFACLSRMYGHVGKHSYSYKTYIYAQNMDMVVDYILYHLRRVWPVWVRDDVIDLKDLEF